MKCPSLFHFYRTYYGGVSKGKVHFARAIVETGKQLGHIFGERDLTVASRYLNQEYGLGLTKAFLRKFLLLADQHYGEQIFGDLQCRLLFIEYGNLDVASQWSLVPKDRVVQTARVIVEQALGRKR